MKHVVKLFLVAAFALMLVPYSPANEWLPPDILTMFEAPAVQPPLLGTKDTPKNRSANSLINIKKAEKQGTILAVKHSPLNEWVPSGNEWVPPDMIRLIEAPAFQPEGVPGLYYKARASKEK